jgi:RimJ/RimL family protein N-acetyltransferase/cytidylate kinase
MLPVVTLRNVSRDDVDRLGWWLEDDDVSGKWFGHYAFGDPVHRGYDPGHMLEASQAEWENVFNDSTRLIFSIYSENGDHIGESQILFDGQGSGELSLLIGRKDRWHLGYGTSAVILLLEKAFEDLRLRRVWVSVPSNNEPAIGLFEKLGFRHERVREIGANPDGSALSMSVMGTNANRYDTSGKNDSEVRTYPVVTVTGLPGSGSGALAAGVARSLGSRMVDEEEITELVRERLGCSSGEIEWLHTRHRSFWHRLLSSLMVPMDWSSAYDAGYYHLATGPDTDYDIYGEHITKKQYVEAISGVIKTLAAEGGVVLHGHANHLFAPEGEDSLNVFVSASTERRAERMATARRAGAPKGAKWLRKEDRDQRNTFDNLFDADVVDMEAYDIRVNGDRVALDTAAELVVGAVKELAPASGADETPAPARETVIAT